MLYREKSYRSRDVETHHSAEVIVPLILRVVPAISVVDVGCGVGTWLSVFKKLGVEEILGIEGDWVPKEHLVIPENLFMNHNLSERLILDRTFDLAICLEVAEHIPEDRAQVFIDTLTCLSPAILFSAAIPGQGGRGHVNEQWPDYWANFFMQKDYQPIDFIRKQVWNNNIVSWWYSQNILLFVKRENYQAVASNINTSQFFEPSPLRLVHPGNYENVLKRDSLTFILKKTIKKLLKLQ
jgi:SAM-dependent methyltransferase